jgi:predicted nucleic-acid-binding protein
MIGTDTNILVRAFLEDDVEQAKKAEKFLEKTAALGELFISSYALLEFAWVLKVKKFSRKEIYESVITLTDSPGIIIGQKEVVLNAAEKYLKGQADFGDYMIMAEGETHGAHKLATFDKAVLNESKSSYAPE